MRQLNVKRQLPAYHCSWISVMQGKLQNFAVLRLRWISMTLIKIDDDVNIRRKLIRYRLMYTKHAQQTSTWMISYCSYISIKLVKFRFLKTRIKQESIKMVDDAEGLVIDICYQASEWQWAFGKQNKLVVNCLWWCLHGDIAYPSSAVWAKLVNTQSFSKNRVSL